MEALRPPPTARNTLSAARESVTWAGPRPPLNLHMMQPLTRPGTSTAQPVMPQFLMHRSGEK